MATTASKTAKRAVPPFQDAPAGRGGPRGSSLGPPYSVREAAALLGVSPDVIEGNYQDLEGFRIGRRILIPRRTVDQLVAAPGDEHRDVGRDQPPPDQAPPAIERVLALLPLLARDERDERVTVAQAALSTAHPE